MSEQVYSSRRERRLAEQGLSTSQPTSSAPLPSRREMRAQQSAQEPSSPAFDVSQDGAATQSTPPSLEFTPLVPEVALPTAAEPAVTSTGSLFEISPSMSHEPQTNSIIIQNVNEISEISGVITDTGQFLRTGSIELPKLTQTGEIATVLESPAVDEAIHRDGFDSFVSSIAPVRATGVINSQTKVGIMPIKNRRGQGQFLFAITTTLLMLTVGALFVVAYMFGVFDK